MGGGVPAPNHPRLQVASPAPAVQPAPSRPVHTCCRAEARAPPPAEGAAEALDLQLQPGLVHGLEGGGAQHGLRSTQQQRRGGGACRARSAQDRGEGVIRQTMQVGPGD